MSDGERQEVDGNVNQKWGEMVKFAVLVLILAGTVLAVAAARPLIFDRIVPALLGWTTPDAEGAPPTPAPTETPAAVEENNPPARATATVTATPLPPTPTPRTYIVEPGDNLTQIAERYGVTIDAILQANQLENAHRIYPGQRLVIPDG